LPSGTLSKAHAGFHGPQQARTSCAAAAAAAAAVAVQALAMGMRLPRFSLQGLGLVG